MAKPDPGTQGPEGPPAQPHKNPRLPLPIKLQHHPVVPVSYTHLTLPTKA